jgi:flagellar protein FlgJ
MTELQGPESRAARNILAAPDAGSAAAAIATDFLRPAPEHLERRVAEYTGMNPGASIPAIMEIMADPYAPQGDKMILGALLEQQLAQMQPPDPMQALDMEYKRAQIEQMRAPQMAGPPQVETFYDEATGQQYKAQWNGQEWVPVGGVQAADGPLVEVNTGGGKFEEAFAKGDADTVATVYNSGLAATRNLGRIDQLESLLNASPTGAGAALTQIAGEWGINTEGLDQIQAAQAVINSLVPEQRQPGSGPMSDADLALFKQSLPRIINQPGGNQTIVNTMRGIAQYDAEGAAIVQRLRSGEIDRPTAFKLLQDRKNPLAGMKMPAGGSAPAPGATLTYNPQTGEFE